jgi:hypothetical protein
LQADYPAVGGRRQSQPADDLSGAGDAILLGRRRAGSAQGPCALATAALEDSDILIQRLRSVYASPSNVRPIEILIRP